jgi:hypothetical protein
MNDTNNLGQSSEKPAEGDDNLPPPEQGSPMSASVGPKPSEDPEAAAKRADERDANPLAPPINTQAGS